MFSDTLDHDSVTHTDFQQVSSSIFSLLSSINKSSHNCDKIVDQALLSTCNVLLADFQRDLFYFEV